MSWGDEICQPEPPERRGPEWSDLGWSMDPHGELVLERELSKIDLEALEKMLGPSVRRVIKGTSIRVTRLGPEGSEGSEAGTCGRCGSRVALVAGLVGEHQNREGVECAGLGVPPGPVIPPF